MSKNIEINIQTTGGTYETLYPKTLGSLVDGSVNSAVNATNSEKADTLTAILPESLGGSGKNSFATAIRENINTTFNGNTTLGTTYFYTYSRYMTTANFYSMITVDKVKELLGISSSTSTVQIKKGSYTGTGSSGAIETGLNDLYLILLFTYLDSQTTVGSQLKPGPVFFIGSRINGLSANVDGVGVAGAIQTISNNTLWDGGSIFTNGTKIQFNSQSWSIGGAFTKNGQVSGYVAIGT